MRSSSSASTAVRLLVAALLLAAVTASAAVVPASEAGAAAPRVESMVVTRGGGIAAAGPLRIPAARVRSEGRRCRVREGLALGVLAALRRVGGPAFGVEGACDALYVNRVGRQRETRRGGWVYKVDRALPALGAADPAGRLRRGRRVTWFFCESAGRCQRTLDVTPAESRVAPGAELVVTVRAHDDAGRGRPATGVEVTFGDDSVARTDADGRATVTAPDEDGRFALQARGRGVVPAYPEEVVVG